jgi:hypothetical protein
VKAGGEAAPIKLGQAELQVGVRMGATISTRNYLSAQHLWTARHKAELCRQREVAIAGKRPIDVQHRSYATTAVLMSVAFLEATVNEVFEATVRAFAEAGASVVLADINQAALTSVTDELAAAGHQVLGVPCDVADEDQVATLIAATVNTFGRLDMAFKQRRHPAPGLRRGRRAWLVARSYLVSHAN